MRRAAIVRPLRTAVGGFGGSLRPVPVETLGSTVVKAVLERSGLDPALIEDVVIAQSYANSETPCIGRWLALEAGLPVEVPGLQTDRRCGGGLQALTTAAMMVQTGACDVVLAGGVESMSNIEFYTTDMRWGRRSGTTQFYDRLDRGRERSQPEHRFGHISGMIETAENLATDYGITREEADAFAAESHRRAAAARRDDHSLLATATHDTKRGEDARARLYALSEGPERWSEGVGRWRRRIGVISNKKRDFPIH